MLLASVKSFFTEHQICDAPVAVAVSGGPDSVALLRAIAILRGEFRLCPIVIAHVNHQLRGPDSDADQKFVHDLYSQLSADDTSAFLWRAQTINVLAEKRSKEGIESTARDLRYKWLTSVAEETRSPWVATGHTADDQAETVLHRLLRGTGVKGLAGIPPRRTLATGVDVIRPLLQVRRTVLLDFLHDIGQPYREDSSNVELHFTRNRIRRELLPLLEKSYNSGIVSLLGQLAHQASAINEQEEGQASSLLAEAERPRAGDILVFDKQVLQSASRNRVCEMFRLVWQRESWSQRSMGFKEWQRIASVVFDEAQAVDLPGRIRVRRKGRVVQVGPCE